ncbi:MAG: M48 family metallopeptidase [Kiritimatiellia bacterium]
MKQNTGSSSILLCAMVAAAIFVTSCASTIDFVTGERTRNFYTVQDDIRLGNQTFEEMKVQMAKDGTAVPSRNAAEVRRVKTIAERIFDASGQRDVFAFDVELFDSKVVNAFAVPGGKIAIFTGLWNPKDGLVADDDELAAVIAHEVAHVTCRHSTEEMTRQMPAQLLLAVAGLYAQWEEDETWKDVVEAAFIVYNGLVVPKYSRKDEFEADRVSMEYMVRAGYDPAAAVRLWKRAYEREDEDAGYMSILSTHPSNKARYEALQRHHANMTFDRGAPIGGSPGASPSPGVSATAPKPPAPRAPDVSLPAAAPNSGASASVVVAPKPAPAKTPALPRTPIATPTPTSPPPPVPPPSPPPAPSVPAAPGYTPVN